ncbi:MAG: hypothetical protein Q4E73_06530 [Lachnospiraceae bacterium]|nr:hypothetical protein [Lachnospiraceae bacterium]
MKKIVISIFMVFLMLSMEACSGTASKTGSSDGSVVKEVSYGF